MNIANFAAENMILNNMEEKEYANSKQRDIDSRYLHMALIWSDNSYAIRRKVGCLIVNNNAIVSDGFNGTPSGFANVCEYAVDMYGNKHVPTCLCDLMKCKDAGMDLVTHPYVLHAESNAIAKLTKGSGNAVGATIYVTDEPCIECSKLIIQSGIKRVVYYRPYRLHQGIELLEQAGIEVINLDISDNIKESYNKKY